MVLVGIVKERDIGEEMESRVATRVGAQQREV